MLYIILSYSYYLWLIPQATSTLVVFKMIFAISQIAAIGDEVGGSLGRLGNEQANSSIKPSVCEAQSAGQAKIANR